MTMTIFQSSQGYSVVSGLVGLGIVVAACSSGTVASNSPADAGVDSTADTPADDEVAIATPSGMGAAASCGAALGSYRKVTVFSNGSDTQAHSCPLCELHDQGLWQHDRPRYWPFGACSRRTPGQSMDLDANGVSTANSVEAALGLTNGIGFLASYPTLSEE